MELTVNGIGQTLAEGVSVADVVAATTTQERGLAVAVNSEVVPRAAWSATLLRHGDRIEVLSAAQGG